MIDIIINKNQCKLQGDELTTSLLQTLDRELSYEISGAKFMPNFNKFGWDGKKRFLSNKLVFPKGLLNRVCNIIKTYNLEYNITDNNFVSFSTPLDISKKLKSINKIPYDYQVEAANKVTEFNSGIFKMPTGSGKSICMALMASKINKSTVIYVIGLTLLYQIHDLFVSIFGPDKIGIVGDGNCDIKTGSTDINIVSVWTAGLALGVDKKKIINDDEIIEERSNESKHQQIRDLITTSKVHIIDECHVCSCDTLSEIAKIINAEHLYGMSASPYSDNGKGEDLIIESVLGSIIVDISASYLIERGFIAQPVIKFIEIPKVTFPKSVPYQTIYKEYIIENEIRNNILVKETIDLVNKGYKVLVLYKNLKHGKILYEKLKNEISCELLSGKDSNEVRENVKLKMQDGIINCVIASTIFDIGIDWVFLSALVNCGGGKSVVRAIQRVGRICRKYKDKKICAVVECLDLARHVKDHSLARKKIYETEPKFKIIWPTQKK